MSLHRARLRVLVAVAMATGVLLSPAAARAESVSYFLPAFERVEADVPVCFAASLWAICGPGGSRQIG
jgi:hypothetical protein